MTLRAQSTKNNTKRKNTIFFFTIFFVKNLFNSKKIKNKTLFFLVNQKPHYRSVIFQDEQYVQVLLSYYV